MGIALTWDDPLQLSSSRAASSFHQDLARSAGVSPLFIRPNDDPEREGPPHNRSTDTQTFKLVRKQKNSRSPYIHVKEIQNNTLQTRYTINIALLQATQIEH